MSGVCGAGAAERVEGDADRRAGDREAEADPERDAVPASRSPPTVAAKWAKIGAIMNAATARSSSTIAKTRCRLGARREKPATNSAGATVAPRPMPVSSEPIRVSAFAGGDLDPEDHDPGGQERHPDQRQVVDRRAG